MTTIGELCDHIRIHVKPSERPNDICLSLAHILPGRLTLLGAETGSRAAESRSAKYAFRAGDVLYGKLRPYLDKAILAMTDGLCTTELLVLRPKRQVSSRYLACVLHTSSFVQHAVSGTTGAQHPRTSWDHIRRFRLPAFDYGEQEQIANSVWTIETAITANLAVVEQGRRLAVSAIDALFGEASYGVNSTRPVSPSWSVTPLGDLCVRSGMVNIAEEGDRIVEYVDVSSICRRLLRISSPSRYRLRDAPSRARKRIRTGDVVFATVRPTLMRIAVVPPSLDDQVCSTAFCVLRPNRRLVEPRFIYYVVQRRQFVRSVGSLETGASYPAVTDRVILTQPVPVPPLDVQRKIIDIMDTIWNTIDLHTKKTRLLEELRRRVLLDTMA